MIAYGAHCAWWDDKSKVVTKPSGLPCCPHCGGVLYETEEEKWWNGVDAHTALTDPNYREFIEWLRGKCFTGGYEGAYAVWEAQRDGS